MGNRAAVALGIVWVRALRCAARTTGGDAAGMTEMPAIALAMLAALSLSLFRERCASRRAARGRV